MEMLIRVKFCMFVIVLFHEAFADIYFHNPRGSNNRLDGSKRNVDNNKRLCNTQNNNRGGNNVGPKMKYYAGSTLMIQWTNQHSCGGQNNNCELVLQYMCGDNVRDGTSLGTIPIDNAECTGECNTDATYGMHESREYYQKCSSRTRNTRLFTADQDFTGRRRQYATHTRQNNGGTRYGYECQEERDYYPYWGPTPWKDIVVMTNNADRCDMYKAESQNVKSRWECVITVKEGGGKTMEEFYGGSDIPNTEALCGDFEEEGYEAKWTEITHHNLPAPECRETEPSRDNHNGNGLGGLQNVYNWTIPDNLNQDKCVLRMRYNISTKDYDGWNTYTDTDLKLYELYGFKDADAATARGYSFRGNPKAQIFPGYTGVELQLAINTAQLGRTFQDRSHVFAIRSRPGGTSRKAIYNLNVRGKRGNLVQTYPSTEYDFVPNKIEAKTGDYVHIQWTGSDSNPLNNAGNGEAGKDRHNLILLSNSSSKRNPDTGPTPSYGILSENYVTRLDDNVFLGLSEADGKKLAFPANEAYFDLDLVEIKHTGTYNYVCTKNNAFTNRSQKGKICVYPYSIVYGAIGSMGGEMKTADESVIVKIDEDSLSDLIKIGLKKMSSDDAVNEITSQGGSLNVADYEFVSDVVCLSPGQLVDNDNNKIGKMTLEIDGSYDENDLAVYWSTPDLSSWMKIENVEFDNEEATFDIKNGGCFFVNKNPSNTRRTLLKLLNKLLKSNDKK